MSTYIVSERCRGTAFFVVYVYATSCLRLCLQSPLCHLSHASPRQLTLPSRLWCNLCSQFSACSVKKCNIFLCTVRVFWCPAVSILRVPFSGMRSRRISRDSSSDSDTDQKISTPTPLRLPAGKMHYNLKNNIWWTIFLLSIMVASTGAKAIGYTLLSVPTMFPAGRNILMTPLNVVGRDARLRHTGPAEPEIRTIPGLFA